MWILPCEWKDTHVNMGERQTSVCNKDTARRTTWVKMLLGGRWQNPATCSNVLVVTHAPLRTSLPSLWCPTCSAFCRAEDTLGGENTQSQMFDWAGFVWAACSPPPRQARSTFTTDVSAFKALALGSLPPPFKSATLSLFSHRPLWCRRKTREGLNKHKNH